MFWFLIAIGYVALVGYILYQAVTLDKYRKWNIELLKENEMFKPPF